MSEIDVTIKARDLTREAFQKVSSSLKELEQGADQVGKQGETGIGAKLTGALGAVGPVAIAAAAAIAGIAAAVGGAVVAIAAFGSRGSDIADVRDQFTILNTTIGNSAGEVLPRLGAALGRTVSDFELMKSVNLGLSQGLRLNANDFDLVGKSARVLADRVGVDAKQSFETLITAMASGRDMTLKTIGLNIDAALAAEKYAASVGKQASELTEAEKKAASQAAILTELGRVLKESGEAQGDFGDRVAAAKVVLQNFTDGVAEAVARSPVLAAGMDAIGKAFSGAFGAEQQGLISAVTGLIERVVIVLVDVAQIGVSAAGLLGRAWSALQLVFSGTMSIILLLAQGFYKVVEGIAAVGSYLPGVGDQFAAFGKKAGEVATFVGGMQQSFHQQAQAAFEGVKGNSAYQGALDKVSAAIGNAKTAMLAAREAQQGQAAATDDTKRAALGAIPPLEALGKTTAQLKREAKEASDWWKALGTSVEGSHDAVSNAVAAIRKATAAPLIQGGGSIISRTMLEKDIEQIPKIIGTLAPKLEGSGKVIATALSGGLLGGVGTTLRTKAGDTILQAITGGGNPIAAVGGLIGQKIGSNLVAKVGTGLTSALGNTIGGALGAAIPGIGAMIGPLIGPLVGKLGGLFGKIFGFGGEEKKINPVRQQFIDAAGGLEELSKKAVEATGSLDGVQRVLNAKTVKEYDAATRALSTALGQQEEKHRLLEQAVQRYGFSIEELGPKWRAQRLDE